MSYHRSGSAHCLVEVSDHVEMALHCKCWGPEKVAADVAKTDILECYPFHGY